MHIIVGAIIRMDEKILMIDRNNPPFGWAIPGGHLEGRELPEKALKREVLEEVGINAKELKLLDREVLPIDPCKEGVKEYEFYLYEALFWEGRAKKNDEIRKISWLSIEEIKKIRLEEVTKYFFQKIKII